MICSRVLGQVAEQPWHDHAHAAAAAGILETVRIARADAPRRRMRFTTDRDREIALSLPRNETLLDGAVLHHDADLMIVVWIDGGPRLRLVPDDAASALRLGYFCGNLHWKTDFRDGGIEIHMDGPEEAFRARLADAAELCAFSVERLEPER